ncbi:MAG: sigma-70 family RNA polymerase sigma factor [Candidatus Zixiibacteriota bacterium]|nr:MAG: sigma-70 family RNA polymerase sigma factor [candidate division Zixibacteria bacterium]
MNINDLHMHVCGGAPEEELFGTLRERFEQFALRRIGNADDAKDVVQNALIVIAREYKQMEFTVSFSAWAYRVLEIRILDYYRTRDRQVTGLKRLRADKDQFAHIMPTGDLKSRLISCLRKLHQVNRRYARIINLRYQGYQTTEICKALNLTPNGLYVALSRARSILKKCLESGELHQ